MKQYYECHITLVGNPALLEKMVDSFNWKFSKIDGDPVLGSGIKCYATKHYNAKYGQDYVIEQMNIVASQLEGKGVVQGVIRQKVELVVYDTAQLGSTKG